MLSVGIIMIVVGGVIMVCRFCLKMKIMVNNYILYPIGLSDTIMHIVEMKYGEKKEE